MADEEEGPSPSGATLESTGERIIDPRLDVFREFDNSLDLDQGGEQREGPRGS